MFLESKSNYINILKIFDCFEWKAKLSFDMLTKNYLSIIYSTYNRYYFILLNLEEEQDFFD
jgi:hypothetical protein